MPESFKGPRTSLVMEGEVDIVVQTGNLTEAPKHGSADHRASWKITQEWKMRVPLSLTAEG